MYVLFLKRILLELNTPVTHLKFETSLEIIL